MGVGKTQLLPSITFFRTNHRLVNKNQKLDKKIWITLYKIWFFFQVAGTEVRVNPSPPETISMSTAIINGHGTSSEDFTKHVFGKLYITTLVHWDRFTRHFLFVFQVEQDKVSQLIQFKSLTNGKIKVN